MMKTQAIISILSTCLCALVVSCSKSPDPLEDREPALLSEEQISFGVVGDGVISDVATKAAAVTDFTQFYATATTGTAGSETGAAWGNVVFSTTDAGELNTRTFRASAIGGKWWPHTDALYNFYASNVTMDAFSASGMTVTAANNATDIICAYKAYSASDYLQKVTLPFKHVYARVSTVTVTSKDTPGYDISDVTIWLENAKTGGTYNLRTGSTDEAILSGAGWTARTPADAVWNNADPAAAGTQIFRKNDVAIAAGYSATGTDNDLYVVPGDYYIRASWTAAKDDYTQDFTCLRTPSAIHLSGGKINAITATLTGNATEIVFGVTIVPWGTDTVAAGELPVE